MNEMHRVSPDPARSASKRSVAARGRPVIAAIPAPAPRGDDSPEAGTAGGTEIHRAIDAALAKGDLALAADRTLDLLAGRMGGQDPGQNDPAIDAAARVISAYRALLETLPPLHQVARHKIHFDDRAAVCFEQLIALLRHQDAQIAELQAILVDLV